jgi:hypothetical protein
LVMKAKFVSVISLTLLASTTLAAGHGGGVGFGRGFGPGPIGGGHVGAGSGFHSAGRGFGGRPAHYYSRGTHFAGTGVRVPSSAVQRPRIATTPNRAINNPRSAQASPRSTLNGRTDHIVERHDASNWHRDWDRRRTHFFHNRFFVFDDGFWFGLDPGIFPWDYYPYYAYDYYPYDYYPGYYADVEPYYYNEGVYSERPMHDPTVSTVQTELTQQGFYNGPADGIFGPATRDAVAKYQIAHHLDVTGSLTPEILESLGVSRPAAS